MSKVRCKMVCRQIGADENGTHEVRMTPVTGGSEENEQYFKWTPGGELKLCVLNKQYFEPGKAYYVDIEEAPE
jgi:hypothetical protein